MSSATQQTTYTTGMSVTASILNNEFSEIYTNINNLYAFIDDTSGSALVTLDTTNSRVGINESAPAHNLHVASGNDTVKIYAEQNAAHSSSEAIPTTTATGELTRASATSGSFLKLSNAAGWGGIGANHNYLVLYANEGERARIDNNGYLGVNDTAPDTWLHVNAGTDNAGALIESTDATATIAFRDNSTSSSGTDAPNVGAVGDDLRLDVRNNGDVVYVTNMPRRNHNANTYVDSHIQSGWGYVQGTDASTAFTTVTLPVTFASDNYRVIVSPAGTNSSVPSDEASTTSNATFINANARITSSSQFTVYIEAFDANGIYFGTLSSLYYVFHWIAIGPK